MARLQAKQPTVSGAPKKGTTLDTYNTNNVSPATNIREPQLGVAGTLQPFSDAFFYAHKDDPIMNTGALCLGNVIMGGELHISKRNENQFVDISFITHQGEKKTVSVNIAFLLPTHTVKLLEYLVSRGYDVSLDALCRQEFLTSWEIIFRRGFKGELI